MDENQRNQHWQQIKNEVERQRTRQNQPVFFSKFPSSKFLYEMFAFNQQTGDAAYYFLIGQTYNNLNNHYALLGYLKAYEFVYQKESVIQRKRHIEKKSLNQLRTSFLQTSQDIKHKFSEVITELEEWKSTFIEENSKYQEEIKKSFEEFHSEELEKFKSLEESYTEKLRLEGPVKYWNDRVKKYRTQGMWWLAGLVFVVFILIAGLVLMLYNVPDIFHAKLFNGDPSAIKGIIIFASILSLGAYLTKTFTRLTLSSFHLQRDAEEREQLTIVYLALIKDSKLETEDRNFVLQSLFSRTDTGLIGQDHFSENISSLISKFLKR